MGEYVVRDDLPFAAVIRSAVTKGFRHFFRSLPTSLGDYHTLCESLRASNVDVLQGRQVRDLMADLRSGKQDWDTEGHNRCFGSKNVARDSAFRLLYIFLQEKTEDSNAAYNATLFVVSHYRIFWYKTRKMVRQAFDSTYTPSFKQKRELDKWPAEENLQEDDATTEEEVSDGDYYWDSDYS
ncbi:geranylgeranyl pyrophosphate synthetase [Colletotrichum graminicola]|nr:geranylgeranyl pyrophosphate synthetase [Colletotrichum graminicola]